jgi:hypothetical protein
MRSIPWSELLAVEAKKRKKTESQRQNPRAKVSQRLRVRPRAADSPAEIYLTLNVSRKGLCFVTASNGYFEGMEVCVTRNFQPNDPANREEDGTVVRVDKLRDGKWGVAIQFA